MTTLLARILLSILMPPLAVLTWIASFGLVAYASDDEETAIAVATLGTAVLVMVYWLLLWRRSVVWSPGRVSKTVGGTLACLGLGGFTGLTAMGMTGINEAVFGTAFGGIFGTVIWLAMTVVIWKETAVERADRIRRAGGDVVFCPRCGYNMTGLYEPRCPECGTKFMLNELLAAQRRDGIADATSEEMKNV
jgi:hypothetical protein